MKKKDSAFPDASPHPIAMHQPPEPDSQRLSQILKKNAIIPTQITITHKFG